MNLASTILLALASDAVAAGECGTTTNNSIALKWSVDAKCALHEIQYGVVGGSFHGSRTSSTNSVVVGSLTPGTAYRFRVRGTAIDEVSGWTDYAATWTCATSSQSATRRSDAVPSASDKEELFAVYRVSERQIAGMPYLDFLSNHNAGTAAGDVGFLTAAGNNGTFVSSFPDSLIARYCVRRAVEQWADYASCNFPGLFDVASPEPNMTYVCSCAAGIDLRVSHINTSAICRDGIYRPCDCSQESFEYAAVRTGKMPLYLPWLCYGVSGALDDGSCPVNIPFGEWFSLPVAGQCAEGAQLGTAGCTWLREPEAYFLRGADLLAQGWNMSQTGGGRHSRHDTQPFEKNLAVFQAAFAKIVPEGSCDDLF